MTNVIEGKFPWHKVEDRPDWVVAAMKKHSGLTFHKTPNGGFFLKGTVPKLPRGIEVAEGLGYMRSTGQWREDAKDGIHVEVFCCMTYKSAWLPVNLVRNPRMIDDLKG